MSPLYLPCISPISPLHLPYISPISPLYLPAKALLVAGWILLTEPFAFAHAYAATPRLRLLFASSSRMADRARHAARPSADAPLPLLSALLQLLCAFRPADSLSPSSGQDVGEMRGDLGEI